MLPPVVRGAALVLPPRHVHKLLPRMDPHLPIVAERFVDGDGTYYWDNGKARNQIEVW